MGRGVWIAAFGALAVVAALASGTCRDADFVRDDAPRAPAASPDADAPPAPAPVAKQTRQMQPVAATSDADVAIPSPVDLERVDRDRDLHGVVVKRDGSPVAGARVQALFRPWERNGGLKLDDEDVPGPRTRSAVDGTFALRLRRGARAAISVRADGFPEARTREHLAGARVRIVLEPPVRLRASVLDETNRVVAGVRLALEPRRGHGAVAAATTDAEGVADFDGLPAATKFRVRLLSFDWAELGIREFETGEGPVCEERLVLKKGRTLTGRVTDDETGAGIAKARIGLNWTCERPVESDAEGRYVLPGWSGVNILSVVAIADGYAREEAEVGALDAIDFKLRRGFEATGRVVDGAGKPVAGALVAFVASVFDRETRDQRTSLGDATADADGRFRVGGLDPRMGHVVIVTAEGLGRARVPLEAPGAAKPVDVGDVALRPGRLLAGRFVDAEGKPLPDRWIVLAGPKSDFGPAFEGNDYGASEDLRTDDLGRFAFADVAPGAYVVRTEWDGSLECRTEVAVTADRDVLDAELRLAPTTTVEIRVVDEKGGPVQGADVMAAPASEEDSDAYPVSVRTDAQGLAQLRVPWDAATLQVDSPYGVTRRFLSGGVVEWRKGDAVKPFVLREGAALQGAVVDPEGKPVARAQLRVEVSGGPWRWRDADDSGRFDLTFEKGAKVRLVFDGNVDGVETGLSGAVDCSAPQTGVVLQTSKIETDRTLLVKATSPSGGPVSGAVIAVSGFRWNTPRTATTDADGVARFDALPARALSVGARGTDAWARSAFIEATPAGQQVVVVLRKGRAMHGEVVDAEGKPAKARVSVRVGDELVGETTSDADGKFALLVPVEVVGPTGVAASGDAGYGETELPPDGAADVKVTLRK